MKVCCIWGDQINSLGGNVHKNGPTRISLWFSWNCFNNKWRMWFQNSLLLYSILVWIISVNYLSWFYHICWMMSSSWLTWQHWKSAPSSYKTLSQIRKKSLYVSQFLLSPLSKHLDTGETYSNKRCFKLLCAYSVTGEWHYKAKIWGLSLKRSLTGPGLRKESHMIRKSDLGHFWSTHRRSESD